MKRLFNILFLFFAFVLGSSSAYSYCTTGFACPLVEMEKQNIEKFSKTMSDYFDKNKKEDISFGKISSDINYNDLFWFNTIM